MNRMRDFLLVKYLYVGTRTSEHQQQQPLVVFGMFVIKMFIRNLWNWNFRQINFIFRYQFNDASSSHSFLQNFSHFFRKYFLSSFAPKNNFLSKSFSSSSVCVSQWNLIKVAYKLLSTSPLCVLSSSFFVSFHRMGKMGRMWYDNGLKYMRSLCFGDMENGRFLCMNTCKTQNIN